MAWLNEAGSPNRADRIETPKMHGRSFGVPEKGQPEKGTVPTRKKGTNSNKYLYYHIGPRGLRTEKDTAGLGHAFDSSFRVSPKAGVEEVHEARERGAFGRKGTRISYPGVAASCLSLSPCPLFFRGGRVQLGLSREAAKASQS